MALTSIKSVSVYVSDEDKALDFYINKLGFEKRRDEPLGMGDASLRWVEIGIPGEETAIILVRGYAGWDEGRVGKFAGIVLGTDDIQKTYKELIARGVEFTQAPSEESWGSQAQFVDQDGNGFVLVG